jgi:2-polyprenyl-3-methyl-5-hydroxy-6-metoxy-1,4-benzoquinol methylase
MIITASHIHSFKLSEINNYEVCTECESYHSTAQVDPKVIYEENDYWDEGDGKTGRSTIEQQVSNFNCIDDCGISKADMVMQFVPDGKKALEIACSPGVILKRLTDKGYEATGIEPNVKYIQFIINQAPKSKVIHGFFPQIFSNVEHDLFDCIVGLDIMEHINDYDGFFKVTHRLLTDGGMAIFMSPIILADGLYRKIDFDHPDEHCWIHSQKFLEPYLKSIFSEVEFKRWIVGHEIIICKK